jgi:hypothetical protein
VRLPDILETGDPICGHRLSMAAAPSGGAWRTARRSPTAYPPGRVFLPWFLRTAPNNVSELTQSPSTNIGRYTLMGDLNPFAGFRQPATGC